MTQQTYARRRIPATALSLALTAGALGGCATMTPAEREQMQADATRPVVCAGREDCELKWGRALQWVLDNSTYKIGVQTSSLITTLGPLPDDSSSAFTISKVPQGDGRYVFDFRAGCDNFIACIPSLVSLRASFVRAVMGP